MIFRKPTPKPWLIRALVPVNRLMCLRWLMKVAEIDLPEEHLTRLRQVSGPECVTFYAPNHPEFFTDWMVDKEILWRVAPMAASWATHGIVNGMGPILQRFWLANNLIAQIPGSGGAQGKEYSIEWALAGHGVLLHPEGEVGWHADTVGPLFSGVVSMALSAVDVLARTTHDGSRQRPVFIAPMVWKLRFLHDETVRLQGELRYLQHRLGLRTPSARDDIARQVVNAYVELLERDERTVGLEPISDTGEDTGYRQRQGRVLHRCVDALSSMLSISPTTEVSSDSSDPFATVREFLRSADRAVRAREKETFGGKSDQSGWATGGRKDAKRLIATARRLMRFHPHFYRGQELTQEQVSENIKRLRSDYCVGAFRDSLHSYIPRPVGPRRLIVRVPQPIRIDGMNEVRSSPEASNTAVQDTAVQNTAIQVTDIFVAKLRERMQTTLDTIGSDLDGAALGPRFANPF